MIGFQTSISIFVAFLIIYDSVLTISGCGGLIKLKSCDQISQQIAWIMCIARLGHTLGSLGLDRDKGCAGDERSTFPKVEKSNSCSQLIQTEQKREYHAK